MAARVLFFGATADIVGTRMIDIETETGSTTASIMAKVTQAYPELGGRKLKVAVNQTYAADSAEVQDGDEIAVFTAVSGG